MSGIRLEIAETITTAQADKRVSDLMVGDHHRPWTLINFKFHATLKNMQMQCQPIMGGEGEF